MRSRERCWGSRNNMFCAPGFIQKMAPSEMCMPSSAVHDSQSIPTDLRAARSSGRRSVPSHSLPRLSRTMDSPEKAAGVAVSDPHRHPRVVLLRRQRAAFVRITMVIREAEGHAATGRPSSHRVALISVVCDSPERLVGSAGVRSERGRALICRRDNHRGVIPFSQALFLVCCSAVLPSMDNPDVRR